MGEPLNYSGFLTAFLLEAQFLIVLPADESRRVFLFLKEYTNPNFKSSSQE
jgi:hypothetical protein